MGGPQRLPSSWCLWGSVHSRLWVREMTKSSEPKWVLPVGTARHSLGGQQPPPPPKAQLTSREGPWTQ